MLVNSGSLPLSFQSRQYFPLDQHARVKLKAYLAYLHIHFTIVTLQMLQCDIGKTKNRRTFFKTLDDSNDAHHIFSVFVFAFRILIAILVKNEDSKISETCFSRPEPWGHI